MPDYPRPPMPNLAAAGSRCKAPMNTLFMATCSLLVIYTMIPGSVAMGKPYNEYAEFPEGNCHTVASTVLVEKQVIDEQGNVIRRCESELPVSKCEGSCYSQTQPSLKYPSLYKKMCLCCKEEQLRDRKVTLNRCYNPDGERIIGPEGYLEAEVQEPAGCACRVCQTII